MYFWKDYFPVKPVSIKSGQAHRPHTDNTSHAHTNFGKIKMTYYVAQTATSKNGERWQN
jgi:hypothetical protein